MPKITVAVLDKFHPHIKTAVASALPPDWTARYIEENSLAARATVLRDADIAFVMSARISKELLREANQLRFIQKLGAGVDNIDLETCRSRGIGVARLHAGNSVPVAEHTILLMLAVYRQLPQIDRSTRAGGWDKENGRGEHRQLQGKTIGLVGLGAVGKEVAKRLRVFDVKTLYYDPVRPLPEIEQALAANYVDFDTLVRSSDIMSLHLPLLPETAGLISAERIRAMKRGAVLINCALGGIVDEAALVAALKDGDLFGAGLDVFGDEPPVGSELLVLKNTVITSHLAGATLDNFSGIIARAFANAEAVLRGASLTKTDEVVAPVAVAAI
jgi:phosphoglycerate dehydrogenase-like enzyme